ncbi:MAG TPA: hypothetical protein VH538_07295 [Gaiellaceae bacterium]|jgi:hypothetical protein
MTVQLAVAVSATWGVGMLMVALGQHRHLLERRTFGRCPSCGRKLTRRACCDVCSRPH